MEIEAYSVIMTTKHSLKSSKLAALKFSQKDILRDPVDSTLWYYMRTSIVEKSVFRSNKKKERKLYTSRLLFIYVRILDSN